MARSIFKTRFRYLIAGILPVILLVGLNYWIFVRPTSVYQTFVRLVLIGQFDEAADMLSVPSEMVANDKILRLTAIDGSTGGIPIRQAEFNVLDEPNRPLRRGITDYLLCRTHFQLCAIWSDEVGSHVEPISFTTRGSKVVINHVGRIVE